VIATRRTATRTSSRSTANALATVLAASSGESWLISMIVEGTAADITSARRSAAIFHPAASAALRCSSVSVIGIVTKYSFIDGGLRAQ
jgi:hypothetical protein